jgi:vancomycin resistance protein YoaR
VALQLPMKIRHWQPHSSYGISYAPVQFDAAVGQGGLDLIFENTLPYAVRIAMNVWEGVVTVRMYHAGEAAEG